MDLESRRAKKREWWHANKDKERLRRKAKWELDPQVLRDYHQSWREANRERVLFHRLKIQSKKRDLDFDLTLEDIVIPTHCPILGIPITLELGKGLTSGSPSVDRIDNTKGYVKGNIQIISNQANTMKNKATPEELRKFAEWVLNELPRYPH